VLEGRITRESTSKSGVVGCYVLRTHS